MTVAFLRTFVLVSAGALLFGHNIVRWAAGRSSAVEVVPALVIACGTVAAGLALLAPPEPLALAVRAGALGLIVAGVLALVRRRSRALT